MARQIGAALSAVLQLGPAATPSRITEALGEWLQATYGMPLESGEQENVVIEWRSTAEDPFVCQLVAVDSTEQVRRTVTVLSDSAGRAAVLDQAPFAVADAPHTTVDLSWSTQRLLACLVPMAQSLLSLKRGELNHLEDVEPGLLLSELRQDLAPGLVMAIVADANVAPSMGQQEVLDHLIGLAIVGSIPVDAPLLGELGGAVPPRPGSMVSITRTSSGLDAHTIAATSLRTKPDSAKRLVLRRQLAAPIPFDLERRRSAAMTRLLTSDQEIDLPTALQLLDDESQRANELGNSVRELQTQLEAAFDEQDSALGDLEDALGRIRYLERAFRDLGAVPQFEEGIDDSWHPDSSVDALVAARELLPYLVITATDEASGELDGHQKRRIWAKKIWLSLRALNDYCRSKADGEFGGDLTMYRDNPPDGAIPLLAEYAPGESDQTAKTPHLREVRVFAVPRTIDGAGKLYMGQHLKIDKGGQAAPRIHLHDDSGGPTRRIYVGYVGPHLPTSSGF